MIILFVNPNWTESKSKSLALSGLNTSNKYIGVGGHRGGGALTRGQVVESKVEEEVTKVE
jgi:hypothetical protein